MIHVLVFSFQNRYRNIIGVLIQLFNNINAFHCCLQGYTGLPGEPGKDGIPGEKVRNR